MKNKDFGQILEENKHIGDWKDGELLCRPDCPAKSHLAETTRGGKECVCRGEGCQDCYEDEAPASEFKEEDPKLSDAWAEKEITKDNWEENYPIPDKEGKCKNCGAVEQNWIKKCPACGAEGCYQCIDIHACVPVPAEATWEELRAGYEETQMLESSIEKAYPEAYRLARKFHELYEQQAPFFGYITNPNSREFYPNSANARLMAYVCSEIVREEKKKIIAEVLKVVNEESAIDGQYLEPSHARKEERNRITEVITDFLT